jgi:RNA polymerase sigma factor (sigma-70 family)
MGVGVAVGVDPAEEAYRLYAAGLVRFATGLVGPSDAADLVSGALVHCLAGERWASLDNVQAYLYRSVLNEARSVRRSTRRRAAREARVAAADRHVDAEPDVDVWIAAGRLSLRQRAVTMLTYVDDLTVQEVAARLGLSDGAVRRHLARARDRLRRMLDE